LEISQSRIPGLRKQSRDYKLYINNLSQTGAFLAALYYVFAYILVIYKSRDKIAKWLTRVGALIILIEMNPIALSTSCVKTS